MTVKVIETMKNVLMKNIWGCTDLDLSLLELRNTSGRRIGCLGVHDSKKINKDLFSNKILLRSKLISELQAYLNNAKGAKYYIDIP